jgi:hypothetical protein
MKILLNNRRTKVAKIQRKMRMIFLWRVRLGPEGNPERMMTMALMLGTQAVVCLRVKSSHAHLA